MDEEGRLQQKRDHVAPVDCPVERVQFAAVMKAVKNERYEAEDIEMNCARRVPPARENEKSDEEIQQRGDPEVVLNRGGVLLRRGDQRHLERLAVPADSIVDFRPGTCAPEQFRYVGGAVDRGSVEGFDVIALLDSRPVARHSGNDVPRHDAVGGVHPGDAVIGNDEARTLLPFYASTPASR